MNAKTVQTVDEWEDLLQSTNNPWRKRLIMLGVVVALLAVAVFGVWKLLLSGGESAESAVQTATVAKGSISKSVSTSGAVSSQSTSDLSFDQAGKVTALNVAVGQAVKKGDVLAEVEADTLQDALTTAQVNLSSAQLKLDELLKGADASDLASAEQSVIQAQSSYDKAYTALQDLYEGPTTADRDAAQQGALNAESQLAKAETARADLDTGWADAVDDAEEAVEKAEDALDEAEDLGDEQAIDKAEEDLEAAEDALDDLGNGTDPDDIAAADMAIESAELALKMANDDLAALDDPPSEEDVSQAQYNVESAARGITVAQSKLDELYAGADANEVSQQQNQVMLSSLSVQRAQENLEKAKIIAPFDGTVSELNISVGEESGGTSATGSDPAIVLNTPDALRLDLTITESDISNVKVGQTGIAIFSALDSQPFPFKIESIGTTATTTQGVVTYKATASLIDRSSLAAGGPPGAASGVAGTATSGAAPFGIAAQRQANTESSAKPLPGMNATVTIIVDQVQDVLVVPSAAIQSEGRSSVVEVQKDDGSTEKVVIETGLTDGSNTEITSGLTEGQTIIVPTKTASTQPSTSTQQGQQMMPMPGGGAFSPGGGQ